MDSGRGAGGVGGQKTSDASQGGGRGRPGEPSEQAASWGRVDLRQQEALVGKVRLACPSEHAPTLRVPTAHCPSVSSYPSVKGREAEEQGERGCWAPPNHPLQVCAAPQFEGEYTGTCCEEGEACLTLSRSGAGARKRSNLDQPGNANELQGMMGKKRTFKEQKSSIRQYAECQCH